MSKKGRKLPSADITEEEALEIRRRVDDGERIQVVSGPIDEREVHLALVEQIARKHLDADNRRLQPEQAVQIGDHAGQVERFRRRLLLHGINSQIGALNGAYSWIVARPAARCYFDGPGSSSSILPVARYAIRPIHSRTATSVRPNPSVTILVKFHTSLDRPTRQSIG